jgi:hypothetical protein
MHAVLHGMASLKFEINLRKYQKEQEMKFRSYQHPTSQWLSDSVRQEVEKLPCWLKSRRVSLGLEKEWQSSLLPTQARM